MNDTPETDHLEDQLGSAAKFSHPIIWKHARQLERERDELKTKYDTLAVENMLEVNKLCKERDEARDQLIHLRSCIYDVIYFLKNGAFDELEKAWKEGLK